MKALSIRQPFASLIASGEKTIELRTWYTHYRGPVLICASKSATGLTADERRLPRGVALCIVDLVDVLDPVPISEAMSAASCFDLVPGDDFFGFVFARPMSIEPFPVSGRLGLFDFRLPAP
ncbi:MAG TPA: RNA-binding protein [Planctomycetaceae bacterium]|nr:RNA-binding protein [Planctomycetaceae bacterium]